MHITVAVKAVILWSVYSKSQECCDRISYLNANGFENTYDIF